MSWKVESFFHIAGILSHPFLKPEAHITSFFFNALYSSSSAPVTCEVPLSESMLHDLRAHSCQGQTGKYQGESSSLQGLVSPIVTVGDTVTGVCHTACAETWGQSGSPAGLTHRAGMAACSGDSSAISSPQLPVSPGHDNPTLF